MNRLVLGLLFLSRLAFGDLPDYIGPVEGNFWENALSPVPFTFTPGALKTCKTERNRESTSWDCEMVPATLSLSATPHGDQVFDRVIIKFSNYPSLGEDYKSYLFTGESEFGQGKSTIKSKVLLRLSYEKKDPGKIFGYFRIAELDLNTLLRAVPQ